MDQKKSELLEGEALIEEGAFKYVATSREWAADVIERVAKECSAGMYPQDLSAFDLGRALGRALVNNNEQDAHTEIMRGLNHWQDNYETAMKENKG